jgi:hypothetical protein
MCRPPPPRQVYRCFESRTPGSDWSVALPEGEDATVVAAGGHTSGWPAFGLHGRQQQCVLQLHSVVVWTASFARCCCLVAASCIAGNRRHLHAVSWLKQIVSVCWPLNAAAAGHSVVAVASSKRLLRLYSHAGRQLAVLALQGQPVAAATAGEAQHLPAGS